jgi:hypothetical protein
MEKEGYIKGLKERHVSQIIRRKMMEKIVPSKKVYKRHKKHKNENY